MTAALVRVLAAAAAVVGLGLLAPLGTVRVPPERVGVRTSKLGGGIEPVDHGPGLHLALPGVHAWTLVPRGTHVLSFGGDRAGDARPSLEVRTRDDNEVRVDVALTFHVRPGEAHALVAEGLASDWLRRVRITAEDVLRAELSALTSEEWFDVERRRELATRVAPLLDARFATFHVELEHLLVHDVAFRPEYEAKLQQKQLSEQTARLAGAKRRVEDAEAKAGLLAAETTSAEKALRAEWERRLQEARTASDLAVAEIVARAETYGRGIRAAADAEHDALVAEGELAVERARAEAEGRRLAALSGPGGRAWLARRAARALSIVSVELDATDPRVPLALDLDAMVRLLLGDPR